MSTWSHTQGMARHLRVGLADAETRGGWLRPPLVLGVAVQSPGKSGSVHGACPCSKPQAQSVGGLQVCLAHLLAIRLRALGRAQPGEGGRVSNSLCRPLCCLLPPGQGSTAPHQEFPAPPKATARGFTPK